MCHTVRRADWDSRLKFISCDGYMYGMKVFSPRPLGGGGSRKLYPRHRSGQPYDVTDIGFAFSVTHRFSPSQQTIEFIIPTSTGDEGVLRTLPAGIHLSPIRYCRDILLGHINSNNEYYAIVGFQEDAVVFYDGVDVSVSDLIIPKEIVDRMLPGDLPSWKREFMKRRHQSVVDFINEVYF